MVLSSQAQSVASAALRHVLSALQPTLLAAAVSAAMPLYPAERDLQAVQLFQNFQGSSYRL